MNTDIIKNKATATESLERYLSLSKELVNPRRDWKALLIILVILLTIAVSFDIYMYRNIVSGDMYVSVRKDELTTEILKKEELKKILNIFETKKNNVVNLKLENLIDPSK